MPAQGRPESGPDATPTPSPASSDVARTERNAALEGMRGLAVALVVLSHIWVVYPTDGLSSFAPLRAFLTGGSLGVSIFLVLAGFLVTHSMTSSLERRGALGLGQTLLRRLIRISAQVYLLLVVVLALAAVDPTDDHSSSATNNSVRAVATYTWNWYVRDNALAARGDLGHLWYLSAELHIFAALAVALAIWGTRRRALVAGVVVLIVAVTFWRWHVFETEGWYSASLRTSTRADAALWGILGGLTWRRALPLRRHAPVILGVTTLAIFAVILSGAQLGIDAYFKVQGVCVAVAATAFVVVAFTAGTAHNLATSFFAAAPLRVLGSRSLTLYVWHLPFFYLVLRHTTEWNDVARLLITLFGLSLLVMTLHRWVEAPVSRWTSSIGHRTPGHKASGAPSGPHA